MGPPERHPGLHKEDDQQGLLLLTPASAVAHLLARRIIHAGDVLDGDLIIHDVSRRHRTMRVTLGGCVELYVKQASLPQESACVRREAAAYRLLAALDPVLAHAAPRMVDWDTRSRTLVTEAVETDPGARRAGASPGLGAALGTLLATLHTARQAGGRRSRHTPWALAIHRPRLEALEHLSAAELECIRMIQGIAPLGSALDRLRDEWVAETLCHNDVRPENMLMAAGGPVLIDWEFAGRGDPAWDLGGAVAVLLGGWIVGIEPRLDAVRPAVRALSEAYVGRSGLDRTDARSLIGRAVRMTAARSVQSAFEIAADLDEAPRACAAHLQFAHNVLVSPQDATDLLTGRTW